MWGFLFEDSTPPRYENATPLRCPSIPVRREISKKTLKRRLIGREGRRLTPESVALRRAALGVRSHPPSRPSCRRGSHNPAAQKKRPVRGALSSLLRDVISNGRNHRHRCHVRRNSAHALH